MKGHPFLPETAQKEFYSETLTRLCAAKCQIKILRKNAKNLRFQDGRIPGFIEDPTKEADTVVRQVTSSVYNTIRRDQGSSRRQANSRAQVRHGPDYHTADSVSSHDKIPSRQNEKYMRENKEWLTAYDWKKVRPQAGFHNQNPAEDVVHTKTVLSGRKSSQGGRSVLAQRQLLDSNH